MPTQPESHLPTIICQAVSLALLISGDMETAETVVADAIESLAAEDLSTEALFLCVCTLSIQRACNAAAPSLRSKGYERSFMLPPELQNVLDLPRMPRYCFVLRFFLGLSLSTSASLLQLDQREVIDYSFAAVSTLGATSVKEAGNDHFGYLRALNV